MRLCLAAMPWLALDTPSLPIGILRRRVAETRPADTVVEYHGGLRWAEYLLSASAGELTPNDYVRLGDQGLGHGLGDWVFAGALHDDPLWRVTELRDHATRWSFDLGLAERMRAHAGDFVRLAADEILRAEPDLVGFTTTFMQTVPSLAVAAELKRRRPGIVVVLGGANCEGPMGAALHRNHRFVDYAVRGEGEIAFPALLDHVEAGTAPADVAGLCWWRGAESVANPETTASVPPALIPMPDYDEWFALVERSPLSAYLSPYVFIEGSRGCWWGEKHQCTFCGLNPEFIAFRSKPAERFWTELSTLVERHQVLDIMTADNIIDMAYYRDLLPRLAAADWDVRLQFEAKANVQAEHIAMLADAGVSSVQYGVENLDSRVLKIMDKGVTGATNVRVLRDSEDNSITVRWNYLYGFPGEAESDYLPVIGQIPALVHLQPPSGATRIALERFSPYFERPELGFPRREPAEFYRFSYDLPDSELHDLAYFFECDDQGIGGEVERRLSDGIEWWRDNYPTSALLRVDGDDALTIKDRRAGWPQRDHTLTGVARIAYDALRRPRTAAALGRHLREQGHDADLVPEWLAAWQADGLVFLDGATFVALALRNLPVKIARQRGRTRQPAGAPA
ncbi:RiPP maturation radical SAM C-methyltransferase [Asanoa sp. WMMD1127]|uniref:RiPP maturation radical SAM C-methyltransferase n=1 Tax=Asanoa sp. WMMD1127 TaxID=3016107 RepID=UPI002416105B|nr:RiPP maturation radical SAM C-methyltransferase [Asanoa sp. WMMD1127]MDG4824883.1 RiPP maturation radical SAM C-methyltransferase [Asanoa sp. WMMD1127]